MSEALHYPPTRSSVLIGVRFQQYSRLAGRLAFAVGCLVLFGWIFDIAALKQILPGLATMKANTAITLMLSGLSLDLWHQGSGRALRRASRACAALGLLIAALTLSEYLGGWDLRIDQLLFSDAGSSRFPGRMSIMTAVSLVLLDLALLLLDRDRAYPLAVALVSATLVIAWIALIGYLYNVASLYEVFPYSSVALHTAAALVLLAAGVLLARLDRDPAALLADGSTAGLMLRRLLPVGMLSPLALGWLRWQGQLAGLYETAFGLVLMVVALTIVLTAFIWWNARTVARLDRERLQMAEALISSDERFRATFEQAAVGLARVGLSGKWLEVNQKLCDIVGYSRAELLELTFQDITYPADLDSDLDLVRQLLAGQRQTYSLEKRYVCKGGALVWINLTVALVRDGEQAPRYFISVVEDISERKHDQALLRQILDTNPNIIFVKDRDSTILLANQALAESYGLPLGELIGRAQIEVQRQAGMSEEELQSWITLDRQVIDTGEPTSSVERYTYRDGAPHWTHTRKFPIDLPNRRRGVLTISEDITARRQAEQALQASEERFSKAFHSSAVALVISTLADGRILDANDSFLRLFRCERAAVLGHSSVLLGMWANPDDRGRAIHQLYERGNLRDYEVVIKATDGTRHEVLLSVDVLTLDGERCLLTTLYDITDRKRVAQALESERLRLRTLIDNLPDLIFLKDTEGRFVVANQAVAHFMGVAAPEQLLGKSDFDFYPPEQAAEYYAQEQQILQTGVGLTGWEKPQRDLRGELHWLSTIKMPLRDQDGEITALVGIEREITARKQAENALRQLNGELEQRVTERTAQLEAANHELEAFSYTVSHDLRAPLRAISGFSRILIEDHLPELSGDAREYLQLVSDNAQHMDRLITDLLAFARLSRQPLKKQPVAPAELVQETLNELGGQLAGREVTIDVGDLPACQADPALLKQVYVNLIANALKFTGKRAVARIAIGAQPADPPGSGVAYFVKDNGTGFDMRYANKLFGVFQRLHRAEDYEGTGVGLALVQRIVHRHGGRIWAEAAVDQGATFFFTLGGE
jgi:PAS domain S-box-containing protein